MVAWHRLGAVLKAAPGWFVALIKFLRRTLRVGLVAQGEDRAAFDATDEVGGCLIVCAGAAGDIAYRNDDLPGRRSGGCSGAQPKARSIVRRATMITVALLPTPRPPSACQDSMKIR
jgi:hypothetical protein